jgi:hypothetical protein
MSKSKIKSKKRGVPRPPGVSNLSRMDFGMNAGRENRNVLNVFSEVSFVPDGTWSVKGSNPPLKRWAIFGRPCGTWAELGGRLRGDVRGFEE